jgi:hypothetical protein
MMWLGRIDLRLIETQASGEQIFIAANSMPRCCSPRW